MTQVTKSYLFLWRIDVGDIAPGDISKHMEVVKEHLETPMLTDLLNSEVQAFFIPVRNESTSVEIVEFNIDSNQPYTRIRSQDIKDLSESEIIQFIKENRNVKK